MNYLEHNRPALKDIENFVVPYVHHYWYKLGVQLLDSGDVAFLQSLQLRNQKSSDQCTQVFIHWLEVKKKPTWNKILVALKSKAVDLPKVAYDIESMLDNRVSIVILYMCN